MVEGPNPDDKSIKEAMQGLNHFKKLKSNVGSPLMK